ncbi:MAG TPA: hypothetical protein VHO01_01295, partial [Jatrophihabitans sp.]|nr:hypothetical protein [Jatrophihabitans sp.]
MGWTFTSDPAVYQAAVQHVLERDPVRNTVALTVLDAISHGQRFGEEPCTLGWFTDPAGEVTGAVSQTPPYGLLLTQVPGGTEGSLVAELRRRRVSVPDVTGERALAWRFGQLWGSHTELIMAQRLFELDRLNQPDPAPAGNPTPATAADVGLIMHWLEGFRAESEPRAGGTPRS